MVRAVVRGSRAAGHDETNQRAAGASACRGTHTQVLGARGGSRSDGHIRGVEAITGEFVAIRAVIHQRLRCGTTDRAQVHAECGDSEPIIEVIGRTGDNAHLCTRFDMGRLGQARDAEAKVRDRAVARRRQRRAPVRCAAIGVLRTTTPTRQRIVRVQRSGVVEAGSTG